MADDIEIYDGEFPIEQSLCYTCEHRLSRVILPLNYEAFGIDIDDYELQDDELLRVEQHICIKINDMDYLGLVTECNQYTQIKEKLPGLIRHDI